MLTYIPENKLDIVIVLVPVAIGERGSSGDGTSRSHWL